MFTVKGPKCCVSRTLEGSPRYRSGSCAICTGPSSVIIMLDMSSEQLSILQKLWAHSCQVCGKNLSEMKGDDS